ncbi:PAE1, partial [Symbiodinium sp. KB8]
RRSGYDRGVNTFNPDGRLFQVEYAIKAIELGSLAVGIQTAQGIVLAAEKRTTSPLLEKSSIEKVYEVDTHVGVAASGLTADARTLVDRVRVEAQNHTFVYAEPMRPESLMQSLSDTMISFGEGDSDDRKVKMGRPFGVSLLLGGVDGGKPVMYCIDPSGTFVQYHAHAIGSGGEGARGMLQERYDSEMTLEDALTTTMRVLVETMEDAVSGDNCEFVTVTPEGGYETLSEAAVGALITKAKEQKAKEEA